jgi:hypothetical protein
MRKELEQKLVERWPQWFDTEGDIRHTAMPDGFTHDDGWFGILWRLCEDLEPLIAGHEFEVLQVKEKFGGLRFYVRLDGLRLSHADDAISRRIGAAVEESFHTCEICGQPGKLREDYWITTVCDEHDASARAGEQHG